MKRKTSIFFLLMLAFASSTVLAQQIQMPQASPTASVSQKIGLTDVSVEYSRPSVKGRKIFGTLVPYGEVWRTGANASTKLTFNSDVILNGNKVPAGTYAFYTIPNKKDWTIILSNNLKLWGAIGYSPDEDVTRFSIPASKSKEFYETMEISFNDLTNSGATLNLNWEKTEIAIPIETEVEPVVMKQIQDMVIDQKTDNPGLLYQAASFYYTTDRDLKTAHDWIKKSVNEDPKYWTMHLKAKIEDKLGLKEEAIKSAEQSKEMAQEAKNMDYVGLNERLIKTIK